MGIGNDILLIVGLVILNGIFASVEIAVISANRVKVRNLAEKGHRGARLVSGFLADSSRFLATIQVAITLSGFLASATGAAVLADPLAAYLQQAAPWLGGSAGVVAIVAVTLTITFVTLVWGELVPKRIGFQRPHKVAFFLARPVAFLARLFSPVNRLLTWSTNLTLHLIGLETSTPESRLSEEEFRSLVEEQALIPESEKRMIGRVFDFGEHLAREVMVPRTDMHTVSAKASVAGAARIMADTGYSRLPVTGRDIDDVIGLVTVKDVIPPLVDGQASRPVGEVKRDILLFPDTKPVVPLLEEMQKSHAQMVVLVDEYGGVAGLVTMEDLLEEIVGDIRDPYDQESDEFTERAPREYLVDGGVDIEEINNRLDLDLDTRAAYETIGGFILSRLGRLPKVGDKVVGQGITYRVEELEGRRIATVLVIDERDVRRQAEPPDRPGRTDPPDEIDE